MIVFINRTPTVVLCNIAGSPKGEPPPARIAKMRGDQTF